MTRHLFLVFDVESVGLHGEGFAVGWVVVGSEGEVHADGYVACPPEKAKGTDEDLAWVLLNVKAVPEKQNPYEVREFFWWKVLKFWREHGAIPVSDVPWPVEANFLSACMEDFAHSPFDGPYPLLDVASIRFAKGLDPLGEEERQENELPIHNPLNDARQSARLLLEALAI